MRIFSLIYTSVRPEKIDEIIQLWRGRAANWAACELIVVTDLREEGVPTWSLKSGRNEDEGNIFHYQQPQPPFNCTRGWNLAAAKSTGKVLVLVSDDIIPPDRWDEQLLAIHDGVWLDQEAVLHVADGFDGNKLTHAILTRARYERLGYFFYPGYESMYNDRELWEQALLDGVVIDARHLLFEHIHPDALKRERDDVDRLQSGEARYRQGRALFEQRKLQGFPLDMGPNAPFVAFVQATRNDFFLEETLGRLVSEGVGKIYVFIPDQYWSGKPVSDADIASIEQVTNFIPEAVVIRKRVDATAGTREQIETKFRNECLAEIRAEGFHNILIVDGDELWRAGTLAQVKQLVKLGAVAIDCRVIPVIGLPGYPIAGALDQAVIYYGGDESIQKCRSPRVRPVSLQGIGLYHFTLTRKTMPEIIQKCRESGHYDDPAYDFEGFIREKLPHILPTLRDVHMYKWIQVWPEVRAWRADELQEIPKCYRPYLAIRNYPATAHEKENRDIMKDSAVPLDSECDLSPERAIDGASMIDSTIKCQT